MEKFVTDQPLPEGVDRELLTILAEECCEVGQRVSKALRFGIKEVQKGQPLSNDQRIAQELGDVICVANMLVGRGLFTHDEIQAAAADKRKRLMKYLQSEF